MKRILPAILSALCISGLLAAPTVSREETAKTWRLLARDIAMWNKPRPHATETVPNFQPPESEVLNRQALIWPEDRDPPAARKRLRMICNPVQMRKLRLPKIAPRSPRSPPRPRRLRPPTRMRATRSSRA